MNFKPEFPGCREHKYTPSSNPKPSPSDWIFLQLEEDLRKSRAAQAGGGQELIPLQPLLS